MAGCQSVGSWVRRYYPIYNGTRFISILWAYHTFILAKSWIKYILCGRRSNAGYLLPEVSKQSKQSINIIEQMMETHGKSDDEFWMLFRCSLCPQNTLGLRCFSKSKLTRHIPRLPDNSKHQVERTLYISDDVAPGRVASGRSWGSEVDGCSSQRHSKTVVHQSALKTWVPSRSSEIKRPGIAISPSPSICGRQGHQNCVGAHLPQASLPTQPTLNWPGKSVWSAGIFSTIGLDGMQTSPVTGQQVLPIWGPCTAWPVPPPVATCEWDSCETCHPHGEKAIPTCLYHHRLLEDKRWEENPKNIEEKGANQQQTTDLFRVGKKTNQQLWKAQASWKYISAVENLDSSIFSEHGTMNTTE